MTIRHDVRGNPSFGDHAKTALKIGAGVSVVALLVLVSWNMFAPDLLGLPEARMRQALGLTLFAGLLGLMLRIPTGRRHRD